MVALVVASGTCLKVGTSVDAVLSTLVPAIAPVAVDDNASVAVSSGATSIDVLDNDSGTSLTLDSASIVSGGGSVAIVSQEVEFTAPSTAGTTIVSYDVSNGRGSDTGVLTIVVTETEADTDFGDAPATNSDPEPILLTAGI